MQKAILLTIYGDDFYEKVEKCKIYKPDGTYELMEFGQAMQEVDHDVMTNSDSFTSLILPWVNVYNLLNPFKTDSKNIDELYRTIMNYLNKNGKESIFDIRLLRVSSSICTSKQCAGITFLI